MTNKLTDTWVCFTSDNNQYIQTLCISNNASYIPTLSNEDKKCWIRKWVYQPWDGPQNSANQSTPTNAISLIVS